MTFASSPIFAIALAVLGVAGLYALHHLRIQPKRRPVATLMFWQETTRPQQTKSLWAARLSHRRTFAMLASVVLLIAAAMMIDALRTSRPTERNVFVIDAGEAMAATDANGRSMFQQAIALAESDLALMPGSPAILTAGQQPIVQVEAGQPIAGVRQQLGDLRTQKGASAASLALLSAAGLQDNSPGRIFWYTAGASVPEDLPKIVTDRISRRTIKWAHSVTITGVTEIAGVERALIVTIAGEIQSQAKLLAVFDDGRRLEVAVQPQKERSEVRVDDIGSTATRAELRLSSSDNVDVGNSVLFKLRPPGVLTYQSIESIPLGLSAALQSIGRASDGGEVAIVFGDALPPASAEAAIRIIPSKKELTLSLIELAGQSRNSVDLERAHVRQLPDRSMPGAPLLTAGNTVVASIDQSDKVHTLYLADSLLNTSADLPRRAAFPVLIADWCNQLLARQTTSAAAPLLRKAEDPLWQEANVFTVADRPATLTTLDPLNPTQGSTGVIIKPQLILLGLALLMLIVETLLLIRRKIV